MTLTLPSLLTSQIQPQSPRLQSPSGPLPAPAQRLSGAPPVAKPGRGTTSHSGPRRSSSRGQLAGRPHRSRRNGDLDSGTPPVAQPGRWHPSHTGPAAGLPAADCSSAVSSGPLPAPAQRRSGTPLAPVAQPGRGAGPHAGLQSASIHDVGP